MEVFQYEADPGNYIEVQIDSLHGWVETVDEYDSNGNWVKSTIYNADGTINTNPD